jgi:outer membrane protein OmpA-like peptidoglycan-associated protein
MTKTSPTISILITLWALGGVAVMGCAHAPISSQLVSARAAMQQARTGAAGQLEPDELLVAQRSLVMAESQEDGSPREAHWAYLAERETRVAMADARRDQIERGLEQDQEDYRRELERVARERGVALDTTHQALADRERTLADQQQTLAQREAALAAEQQARQDAEQRASDAMARLRELASVREEPTETVITLSGEVLFESDRAELREGARERLTPVADAIRATGETAVIAGFTDSRGSDEYNRDLSQRRADAVRDFLIGEGVPSERIVAEGRGEASPIAANTTAEGRAENRRVEISLHPAAAASSGRTGSPPVATR